MLLLRIIPCAYPPLFAPTAARLSIRNPASSLYGGFKPKGSEVLRLFGNEDVTSVSTFVGPSRNIFCG